MISNLIYILSLFFSKLNIYHQFFDFSLFFVYHFFSCYILVVTVNNNNMGRIQNNEFE